MAFRGKQSEQAAFVGNKLNFLFNTVRKPSGEEYSLEDVGRATGFHPSYIGRMRDGKVANPGREVLAGLSTFFHVDPGFWFRAGNELVESEPDSSTINVVSRKLGRANLTAEQEKMFERMVDHVIALVKEAQARSANEGLSSDEASE